MFVSPHDDDVVIGAGLTFQVGLAEGARSTPWWSRTAGWATAASSSGATSPRSAARKPRSRTRFSACRSTDLRFIECPDCNLNAYRGRHFTTIGAPTEIEGAGGMQNAFTYALRQIRPNRVFLATSADLHPDHQIVHEEVLISLFHAQGNIWPELGPPDCRGAEGLRVRLLLRFSRAAANPHRNASGDARNQAPGDSGLCQPGADRVGRGHPAQRGTDRVSPRAGVPFLLSRNSITRCSRGRRDAREDLLLGRRLARRRGRLFGRRSCSITGLTFDYVPSDAAPPATFSSEAYAVYVVSDYPAGRFGAAAMAHVAEARRAGRRPGDAGRLGEFFRPAGGISPVAAGRRVARASCSQSDDRRNCAQPCLIHKAAEHPILDGLPWDEPPGIGGFNALTAKPGTRDAARRGAVCRAPERRASFEFVRGQAVAAVGRRAARPGPDRGLGDRRGAALGRRTGRLGRPAGGAGRGRRDASRSATGTPGSSAICWPGREISSSPLPPGEGQGEGS